MNGEELYNILSRQDLEIEPRMGWKWCVIDQDDKDRYTAAAIEATDKVVGEVRDHDGKSDADFDWMYEGL